ncbi:MAG: imidazole glycerol phosphate synthase subunit HisH [Clostridia bacterium]|nr:imidazole glycerol phosphate synthase subunit HisH [Clostridia bacterium]
MSNNVTAIVDYGVGNLFSLRSSLEFLGCDVIVTDKKEELINAKRIILPGVGAFEDAVKKLRQTGLDETVTVCAKNGKPLLGICLGMQMLFDNSLEYGNHKGLGLIPGSVVPLKGKIDADLKVPHIGWNKLAYKKDEDLFKYIDSEAYVYYVHSYYADTDDSYIIANSDYSIKVTGAVKNANVYGTQFHPEKSGKHGLLMLKAFCEKE